MKGDGTPVSGSGRVPWRRFAPLVLVVVAAAAVVAMGWHRHLSLDTLVRHRSAIDAFIDSHYPASLGAFIGVYIAVVGLSLPGAVFLTIAGGFLFGWLTAAVAVIVGATA